ncbi:MAG: ferrochelatase [Legionellaceae bacterium]
MNTKGLLIINLGTPSQPTTRAVRQYLATFLADKRVIDLPFFLRYFLLYAFILPFRPQKSAHAYQAIWTDQGSPLLLNSEALLNKLRDKLRDTHDVALGMRYGEPSLHQALNELAHCNELTILPLYPQYSSAATGSSIEKALRLLAPKVVFPSLHIIRDFYTNAGFIQAQADLIKPHIGTHDYFLFSYHGVPEQHIKKSGCSSVCEAPCPVPTNKPCYRAQCYETTALLIQASGLSASITQTTFQSRLGKTPWIKPYTDEVLPKLAESGIKRLAVCCPSFLVDCLETLEEIGLRAKEQWLSLGGETLTLIPCINDGALFIADMIL